MKADLLLCTALAVVMTGCGVGVEDDTQPDEGATEVAAQRDAITANSYATAISGFPAMDLGPESERTCFLQGLSGEVRGVKNGPRAGGRVYRSNGRWWLRAYAGSGSGVKAHAACIDHVFGRQYLSWPGNQGNGSSYSEEKRWLVEGASDIFTKCFLTEVMVDVGLLGSGSYVRLQRERIYWGGSSWDSWTIGGNFTRNSDNTAGGTAAAVCVKIWNDIYPYSRTASGSAVLAPTSKRACSITRLSGSFAYNNNGGLNDGVRLFINGPNWNVFSSGGKGIQGECYENLNL